MIILLVTRALVGTVIHHGTKVHAFEIDVKLSEYNSIITIKALALFECTDCIVQLLSLLFVLLCSLHSYSTYVHICVCVCVCVCVCACVYDSGLSFVSTQICD